MAKPILLLEGFFKPVDLELVQRLALTPVIHNPEQVEILKRTTLAAQTDVYLKVNSGMNRLGFGATACARHTSAAHAPAGKEHHIDDPLRRRRRRGRRKRSSTGSTSWRSRCAAQGRSLANSAALIRFPEARGDWVRPGIMLYGCSPFADRTAESLGLKPAMTLTSEIIATQQLQPGERVGYGLSYEAAGAMTIGVVACGYADGYPRHASTGTPVLVNGALAHRWTRIDGHDHGGHLRHPGRAHRHTGDALGRGAFGRRGRRRRGDAELRAPVQAHRARADREAP